MRLTEKQFAAILQQNKNITVKEMGHSMRMPDIKQGIAKYRNIKVYCYPDGFISYGTKVDGHGKAEVYDSIKEYNRYCELLMYEKGGLLCELKRQVPIVIQNKACRKNGELIKAISYTADFTYVRDGQLVVEDVKPFDKLTGRYRTTKDFALKWKLLKVKYPDRLFEIF